MHDKIRWGDGSPEGVVWAQAGTIYQDMRNGGVYRKGSTSGMTGWVQLGDAGGSLPAGSTVTVTAYDTTKTPSAHADGVSISYVNGDATLPTAFKQGLLRTVKLPGTTFDFEKFVTQEYFPAINGNTNEEKAVWTRRGATRATAGDPSGWTPWTRQALSSEIPAGGGVIGNRNPDWQGLMAWTDDVAMATTTLQIPSGQVRMGLARAVSGVAAGGTLRGLHYVATAGAGLTYARLGVYRVSDGAQVALSGDLSTAWQGTGHLYPTLTVSTAIAAGDYLYVALLATGTTMPIFSSAPSATLSIFTPTVLLGATVARLPRAFIASQATLPATLPALSAAGNGAQQVPWAALG